MGFRLLTDPSVAEISTFIFAGHETTSAAVSWTLYAMSLSPSAQDTLRAEVRACIEGDHPSMETLNNLPYLDAVVHETLRLYAPISATVREVGKDDVIPTENEWTDKQGNRRNGIPYAQHLPPYMIVS